MIDDFSGLVGKQVLNKHQMSYSCMTVRGNYALISVRGHNGMPRGYEVWKLRLRSGGYGGETTVKFPSDEEFGYYGWSYQSYDKAQEKFEELSISECSKRSEELVSGE